MVTQEEAANRMASSRSALPMSSAMLMSLSTIAVALNAQTLRGLDLRSIGRRPSVPHPVPAGP
jgi:hypothetical protein